LFQGRASRCRAALVVLSLTVTVGLAATSRAADRVERAGDALQVVLPAVSLTAIWLHTDAQGLREYAASAATTVGLTYVLKVVTDEDRPNGLDNAFPSGHTSWSVCAAEFLRKRYGLAWGAPVYAAAAFVAYSRVRAGQHYTHDVVAGALIGLAASGQLTHPFHGVSLALSTKGSGYRVGVEFRW
jgi:membrane-associated phospholipid phosphatase